MFLKSLYNAYVYTNYTEPFLHSLNTMSRELEQIMEVNNIKQSKEENRQQRRKKKWRNK